MWLTLEDQDGENLILSYSWCKLKRVTVQRAQSNSVKEDWVEHVQANITILSITTRILHLICNTMSQSWRELILQITSSSYYYLTIQLLMKFVSYLNCWIISLISSKVKSSIQNKSYKMLSFYGRMALFRIVPIKWLSMEI
jgi:hypothetical protein